MAENTRNDPGNPPKIELKLEKTRLGPFVAVRPIVRNVANEPLSLRRYPLPPIEVDPFAPLDRLRAFGTFGLKKIAHARPLGSYAHIAVVEPSSRRGTVLAWLTHDRASGLLFLKREGDKLFVEPRLDFGNLRLEPRQSLTLETLLHGHFDDARLGLEAYADAVAAHYKIKLRPQPTVYCSWYHAGSSNERQLARNAEFAARHLAPFGFSVVQIDDGWQAGQKGNGPKKNFTTHNPTGPYRSGMKKTADHVRSLGLVPGLWFMPFAGNAADPFFADKQHLFATKDGKPYEVRWGGTCFDLTKPETLDYVRSVARRICQEWGFGYVKIDGLWTGMASRLCYVCTGYREDHLGESHLANPEKTHIEAFRDGLRAVREGAGPATFILGCTAAQNMRTLGASFGLVDAMRVGPDNGPNWGGMKNGPRSGSNLYFLNRRVWYNDPDPIYVRPSVPLNQARALASWVTLAGQLNASAYQYEKLPPERLELLRRTMPAHDCTVRPADLFERPIPSIWLLTNNRLNPPQFVVGLFNWEDRTELRIEESLEGIGLPPGRTWLGFDFWEDGFVGPLSGKLEATLKPASCRVLSLRPDPGRPVVLSTSRHITQGAVDLLSETWDGQACVLGGTSDVVGGDPYEVRIAAPEGLAATAAVADAARATLHREQAGIRLRLQADKSARLHWQVFFEKRA